MLSDLSNRNKAQMSSMSIERFFNLFINEMKTNDMIRNYHKFFKNMAFFDMRKAYFCQRLKYITDRINDKSSIIWDCGCGYGTTSLFLAMNGIRVHGTTIGDNYTKGIFERREYWSKYGDPDLFSFSCESLFDAPQPSSTYDAIIIQDTLHHLEPLQQALAILNNALKPDGKMIILEANGANLVHRIKLYLMRGNNRVIEQYDDFLKKKVLYGNENYRSLRDWKKEFDHHKLIIEENPQYIKFFYPWQYNGINTPGLICQEQKLAKAVPFLRELFFFGMNFVAKKVEDNSSFERANIS